MVANVLVPSRGLRLRGLHPIFLSHHLSVLLLVLLVVAIVMIVRQYRNR